MVASCALSVVWRRWQTRAVVSTGNPQPANRKPRIKVAVLGTGSLGKEHARIYAELDAAGLVHFVGVHDVVAESARKVAERYGVPTFVSVTEAAQASDALSVVTPTTTHFELAGFLLQRGRHVLVEKPMTETLA